MTRRQWTHIPLVALVVVTVPVGVVLAIAGRLTSYLLRLLDYLHGVYTPSRDAQGEYIVVGEDGAPPFENGWHNIPVLKAASDDWSPYHDFRARTDPPPWGRGEDE